MLKIPLGTMTLVTGVSGSGKSSLINEILYKTLASTIYSSKKNQVNIKRNKRLREC